LFNILQQETKIKDYGTLPSIKIPKHHASQSQDRNNKYFILYIEFCISNKFKM